MLTDDKESKYWTKHNVTNHHSFLTIEDSLQFLAWRNAQYYQYDLLMPVQGYDDKVILDYGCGPGHDLVGLGHYSRPKKLYGLDVSLPSLKEAKRRLDLHQIEADLLPINVKDSHLPFENDSVDYIHCSGVLHHIPNYLNVLQEFKRILKPDGKIKIMVYNYNSIWVHLYVAYLKQMVEGLYKNEEIRTAFSKTTDGPNCPTSYVYKPSEFVDICTQAGFTCRYIGAAISIYELSLLPKRFDAIMHRHFPQQHRDFLLSLTFDQHGCPLYEGEIAGIDACYEISKS